MYRIAVIQNEVEMQHSGYVDSVPKYIKQDFDLSDHVFNRFSSVNIGNLFIDGEDYLLDYDCVIIGTNATSDGDIYETICKDENRTLLQKYISLGKGILICSQKKLRADTESSAYNARKTFFMPEPYEYQVVSRPPSESSSDGNVIIYEELENTAQHFICSYPRIIDNDTISERCTKNDFQPHFYRDYIIPTDDSAYAPILWDKREESRFTLLVATPRKNERIVVSTMALDWAGHYELIENILRYLIIGIPTVAFIDNKSKAVSEFDFLISEANLSRIAHHVYNTCAEVITSNLDRYHTLYVFSPSFQDAEVFHFWEMHVKEKANYSKLLHYKYVNNELVLVNFSYYSYIDTQKKEVETWLKCEYRNGLWGNSFWKTYDVLIAFNNMGISIAPFLKGYFTEIRKHYKNGSYDGVLAPTCGLFELESMILADPKLSTEISGVERYHVETKEWLIAKYRETSVYNRKFIIRSFYSTGYLHELFDVGREQAHLLSIVTDGSGEDKLEIDLCLDIDVCLIYRKLFGDRKEIQLRIKECIRAIIDAQLQNGRWDNNLGKTAKLLAFLIKYQGDENLAKYKEDINIAITRGIVAIKNAYEGNNWERNVVTTANAITAIVEYEKAAPYKSKDFLNQVNKEAKLVDSYNSLVLALSTINSLTKKCGEAEAELRRLKDIRKRYESNKRKLRMTITIAVVSVLLILSYYLFLALRDLEIFKSMIIESFMWIPIVIGAAITGLIEVVPRFIIKDTEADK